VALSDNIWWTRKARIQTEKRLLSNAFQSQVILLWYSFFSVAVSIYFIMAPQDGIESISWVVYSVLTLCISGFINGLSFKERASLIKECYENLNSILYEASQPDADTSNIARHYESVLNACENHTDKDFAIALCQEYWSSHNSVRQRSEEFHSNQTSSMTPPRGVLTRLPTSHHWFIAISYFIGRCFILGLFYVLPILICYFLNSDLFIQTANNTGG